jgi:hypothetical protein
MDGFAVLASSSFGATPEQPKHLALGQESFTAVRCAKIIYQKYLTDKSYGKMLNIILRLSSGPSQL